MWDYEDIIHRPRYVSVGRATMSIGDRAAQFSAFAALTGFDGVIRETGRLTDDRAELDEGAKAAMDRTLQELTERIGEGPQVSLVWFRDDGKKEGGAYLSYRGTLKKLDTYQRLLCFTDGARIPVDRLYDLKIEEENTQL